MSQSCSHDCGSCAQKCSERVMPKKQPLPSTHIKKIVAVLSGKGGVGKSMVSSLIAVELAKKGYKVGIMDADITGPSIPKMFGLKGESMGDEGGIFPILTERYAIETVSVNSMLATEDTPVLWRGPIIAGMVGQFYTDVYWKELDFLLIDMPPGTSDVALTILQDIPVDGLVMVTSASKLISMVVSKAIKMAETTKTKILGLVENMSYVKCPDCGKMIPIYNESNTAEIAQKYNLNVLAKMPIDTKLSNLADNGDVELYDETYLDGLITELEKTLKAE